MPDLINKKLGKYRVQKEIARGGMGTVYKAWDAYHKRHVALKVLPAYFIHDELFVERFRREAESAESATCPQNGEVWAYGDEDGNHLLDMKQPGGLEPDGR